MSKKPANQKRAQRQQQERAALNKIFNTFLVGLSAECYLFLVYRGYIAGNIDSLLVWDNILKILMWVGLAALVGGGLFAFVQKKNEKMRNIGAIAAGVGGFFALSSWVMTYFFDAGVISMCAIVPVLTVLTLIYFLYQRDCFLNTTLLSGALFTIWVCGRGLDGSWRFVTLACAIAIALIIAIVAIASRRLQFNDGKLGERQILPVDCDYRMIYIVSVVSLLLVIAAFLLPSIAYYLVWAAVIALFGELAYYTTKMM